MSKLLANQISNYNDNGPVEAKDGINVANGKPFQVNGASGSSGEYLKSTGSSVAWTAFPTTLSGYGITDAFSGAYADLTGKPTIPSNIGDLANVASTAPTNNQVLKWNGSAWSPAADSAGIALNSISVSVNAVGASTLTYTNTTGEFNYTPPDLSAYLTSVGSIGSHTDVNISSVQNDQVLKYNSTTSKWENKPDATGGGGSTTFLGLTDTPANFTSQAGKYLKVNAGATALEYVDPIETGDITFGGHLHLPDGKQIRLGNDNDLKIYHDGVHNFFVTTTHTTYYETPYFVLRGSDNTTDFYATFGNNDGCKFYWNHSLKLSTQEHGIRIYGGIKDKDNQLGTAGQILSTTGGATAELDWIDAPSGGGATVTTDDSAPSSPTDGDLWWKSDEGRLKIYYQDTDSSQWVDAFPVQTPTTLTVGNSSVSITDTGSNGTIQFNTDGTDRWKITSGGHIIPYTNAAFDIGNAEYKVRHLFLSDNTVYFQGDFLKVAQHNSGGSAQSASYLIPLAKLKDALNASADYEAFKTAILAITDA